VARGRADLIGSLVHPDEADGESDVAHR